MELAKRIGNNFRQRYSLDDNLQAICEISSDNKDEKFEGIEKQLKEYYENRKKGEVKAPALKLSLSYLIYNDDNSIIGENKIIDSAYQTFFQGLALLNQRVDYKLFKVFNSFLGIANEVAQDFGQTNVLIKYLIVSAMRRQDINDPIPTSEEDKLKSLEYANQIRDIVTVLDMVNKITKDDFNENDYRPLFFHCGGKMLQYKGIGRTPPIENIVKTKIKEREADFNFFQ
jgi:hypothetical protein